MTKLRILVITLGFALVSLFIASILFARLAKHLHMENHAFGEVIAFGLV